jgi:membrane-associated phospholipid phosphatase
MSVSIGREGAPGSRVRAAAANFVAWLSLIGRPRRFRAGRLLPPTARLALGALTGLTLVAGAMYFADRRGVALARMLPLWLVEIFNEITDFGQSGWFLIPIGGVIILAAVLSTAAAGRVGNLVLVSVVVRLSFVFMAIAVPGLMVTIVKRLIGRVRPSDSGPFAYMPWSWRPEYASLPSGHATTAVAAAVAIGAIWPAARVPMAIYALLIAASRVVIQAHFVSDVIAAAFVGAFGAIVVRNWFAARRLAFVPGTDGAVHALPGPSWRRVKAVARGLIGQ